MTASPDVAGASHPWPVGAALQRLLTTRRDALLTGLLAALLLAVPDLLRQLPVRDGSGGRAGALVVDALGVLSATVVQVAVVGIVAGVPALRGGAALVLRALHERPGALLTGLVVIGAASALITLPVSVAALGAAQVLGPLEGPTVTALLVAQTSDVLATALTAPWFALLVARLVPDGISGSVRA